VGTRIVEAAHAAQGSVSVVEGAVLLHQDHDVLRVEKGASWHGLDRKCLLHRLGNGTPGSGQQSHLFEKIAPRLHALPVLVWILLLRSLPARA